MNLGQTLKPLTSLLLRAGAQTLIILQMPAHAACPWPGLPAIKLAGGIEGQHLTATARLQERSSQRAEKAHLHQTRPLSVKEVHEKTLDMGAVMILVRHHHYTTITEILLVLILLTLAQAENGLDRRQLLILVELLL